jgi:hypothetical protein
MPSASTASTRSSSRSSASRKGAIWVICEPMWQSMPCTSRPGSDAAMPVGGQRLLVRDAELVLAQAGRDVGVGAGVDVRVHAQADGGAAAHRRGHADSRSSSGRLSTLKQRTPAASAWRISSAVLPTPENTTFAGSAAGREHPREFAAGDDVEAAAGTGKGLQHRQVRVGLHRVADQVRPAGQRTLVGGQRVQHRALRIDVQRAAEARASAASGRPSRVRVPAPSRARWGAPGSISAPPGGRAGRRRSWRLRQCQRTLLAAGARAGSASRRATGWRSRPLHSPPARLAAHARILSSMNHAPPSDDRLTTSA